MKYPRIVLICISLIVVGLSSAVLGQVSRPSNPIATGEEKPGHVEVLPAVTGESRSLQEATLRSFIEQQKTLGWIEVDEEKASSVERAFGASSPVVTTMPDVESLLNVLRVVPSSVTGTMLASGRLDGVTTAGGFVDGGWTGLVRLFTLPDVGRVILEEYDYVAAGSHYQIPSETFDSYVNGYPMIYRAFKAPSGKSYTEFVWFTKTKQFRLMVDGLVMKSDDIYADVEQLLATLL